MTAFLVLLLVACTSGKGGDDTASTDSTDTTGESGETGESGIDTADSGDEVDLAPTAMLSTGIGTVMTVSWTTTAPGTGVVEFGPTVAYGASSTDDGALRTDHSVLVAGMKPDTDVHWRVRSIVDGVTHLSADQVIRSGPGTDGLPPMATGTVVPGAFHSGFRLVPISIVPNPLVIIDDTGTVVWWTFAERGLTIDQAAMDWDGLHVLYMVSDTTRTEDRSALLRVSLDHPEEVTSIPLPRGHHSFVQLPDGHIVYYASDPRADGDQTVVGDAIIEVDADGSNPRTLFDTWDRWVPNPVVIEERSTVFYPGAKDWTHANSLQYDILTDTLICSFHNIDTVMKLELDGTVDWVLGATSASPETDFVFTGTGDAFYDQHNPQLLSNGHLLLFDNGPECTDGSCYSEVTEYTLDQANGTFSEFWNFEWDQSLFAMLEGDVQRYDDNGATSINWGAAGVLSEVTQDGEIVWEFRLGITAYFAFGQKYTTLGGPIQ